MTWQINTESNGVNRIFANKGNWGEVFGHLFIISSSSHSFNKADSEPYLVRVLSNEVGLYDVRFLWTIKLILAYFTAGIIVRYMIIKYVNRPVGWAVTRSSLEWRSEVQISGLSNRTECCQQLATAATFLRKELCCTGAMTRRWGSQPRYTFRRNTTSIMKDMIWFE